MTAAIAFDLPMTQRSSRTPVATDRMFRDRWPWYVALVALGHYLLIGYWLLERRDIAIGDAISRSAAARMMVQSSDPHLSAWGFYWMPLPAVSRVPFVLLLDPLGLQEMAGIVASAIFLALTIPVIAAIGRSLAVPTGWTAIVCLVFAASPITIWSGGTGMSEPPFGLFVAIVVLGLVRFADGRGGRDLVIVGAGLAGCMGCRFETIILTPVVAAGIAMLAGRAQWRAAVTMVVAPPLTVFLLWTFASALIQRDAFFWYHVSTTLGATPDSAAWLPEHRTAATIARLTAVRVGAMAPALFIAPLALVVPHRRRRVSLVIATLSWVTCAALAAQLLNGTTWATPRYYYHTLELAALGVLWLLAQRDAAVVRAMGMLGVGALAVGAVTGAWYLSDPAQSRVDNEHVLMRGILGLDAAPVVDGDMSMYRGVVRVIDPLLADGDRIAMDTIDAAPFLFSSHPRQFILPENRDSERILADPEGRFELILVRDGRSTSQGDTLRAIVANDSRWRLVEDFGTPGRLYRFDDGAVDDPGGSPPPPTNSPDVGLDATG